MRRRNFRVQFRVQNDSENCTQLSERTNERPKKIISIVYRIIKSKKKPEVFEKLPVFYWRSERDLNPRAAFTAYSLSRGAPSASWVSLQVRGRLESYCYILAWVMGFVKRKNECKTRLWRLFQK